MERDNRGDENEAVGPESLVGRVEELERVAESLADTPDEEVVAALERALGLLEEINAGVQSDLESAGGEVRELGNILDGLNFGSFDEALEDLERRERGSDASSG